MCSRIWGSGGRCWFQDYRNPRITANPVVRCTRVRFFNCYVNKKKKEEEREEVIFAILLNWQFQRWTAMIRYNVVIEHRSSNNRQSWNTIERKMSGLEMFWKSDSKHRSALKFVNELERGRIVIRTKYLLITDKCFLFLLKYSVWLILRVWCVCKLVKMWDTKVYSKNKKLSSVLRWINEDGPIIFFRILE